MSGLVFVVGPPPVKSPSYSTAHSRASQHAAFRKVNRQACAVIVTRTAWSGCRSGFPVHSTYARGASPAIKCISAHQPKRKKLFLFACCTTADCVLRSFRSRTSFRRFLRAGADAGRAAVRAYNTISPSCFPITFPERVTISPGCAGRYCIRKRLKLRSPIKQIPVESFLSAVASPACAAIARSSFFCRSPMGNIARESCACVSPARKYVWSFPASAARKRRTASPSRCRRA